MDAGDANLRRRQNSLYHGALDLRDGDQMCFDGHTCFGEPLGFYRLGRRIGGAGGLDFNRADARAKVSMLIGPGTARF